MPRKYTAPVPVRTGALVLTGTAATVVKTATTDKADATSGAIPLGYTELVQLRMSYTRDALSTTGRPIIRMDVSLDSTSTSPALVTNWQPVYLIDSASFTAGAVDMYVEVQRPNPTALGTTIFGSHPVNVSCANWLRVQLSDVDAANPGTVTSLVMGGLIASGEGA